MFLSLAITVAIRHQKKTIYYAAHQGDSYVYPDCRKEFVESLKTAVKTGYDIDLQAPFLNMTKKDVATLGKQIGVPLHWTWSCYEGGEEPCQKCGACVERNESLA